MNSEKDSNLSIGIFDSGIGGLTVVKETIKILPFENILYLGDTARVPYGTKSSKTVIRYAESNARFLISMGVKVLVIACNTASAYSLETLRESVEVPVIGVIAPGARKAVETTRTGKIGVIGTPSTIKSEAYVKEIRKIDKNVDVFPKACPLFVPLAEEGWHENQIALSVAEEYLGDFKSGKIDTLILGCTHYPLLKNTIRKVLGEGITLVDSAEETAKEIKNTLENKGLLATGKTPGRKEYYLTDNSESFINTANRFLGKDIEELQLIDIV